jgi:hypothetical protein
MFKYPRLQTSIVNVFCTSKQEAFFLKYKASKDIPRIINTLNTLSPSEIANAASTEYDKKVTAISVSMWLQRHPEFRKNIAVQLSFPNLQKPDDNNERVRQRVLAELYVNNAMLFQIKDMQTLECARKYLDIVEEILKP